MGKTAVILFNLGGPDSGAAIQPFLFNLFFDPAIIALPRPLRWALAKLISTRRAPVARQIYDKIGGRSPILPETEAQAAALEADLGADHRIFIAMRYWHPFTEETAAAVKAWGPDRVVLAPLYPHFSTTTTGSSVACWRKAAAAIGLTVPTTVLCCYPQMSGLVAAMAGLIRPRLGEAEAFGRPRLLFSAHGLPQKIVDRGDPYPQQVRQTAEAVAAHLALTPEQWRICYQSRVGPAKWLRPSLDEELAQAARDRVPVVVTPIAFVSEHSETLVELDIEYRHRAVELGMPAYIRVPAVGTHPAFIAGLADLVRQSPANGGGCGPVEAACPRVREHR
jgi:ferrochelatase